MNAAVPPFHHQHGSDQGSQSQSLLPSYSLPPGRMLKRRRLDSADEYGVAEDWNESQSHFPPPPPPPPPPSAAVASATSAIGPLDYANTARAHNASAVANAVGPADPSHAVSAWQGSSSASTAAAAAAVAAPTASDLRSYPPANVSSYPAQPYYPVQPTDLNTYNAPWPSTAPSSFANQPANYSIPAPPPVPPAMPYFPPQSAADTAENPYITDAALPVSSYTQGLEAPPSQYAHSQPSNVSDAPLSEQQSTQRGDGPGTSSSAYFEDASMQLKIQSLAILENLATQLIHTIAKAHFPQIRDIMRGSDSEDGQAYTTLKNLFDQTRKVYSRESPFIDAIAIQMFQPAQQEVIRKANIATFISSILGAHDVSFFHLNEFFMETFVPLGHRLLKWQGAIYLELKTQTYISALMNSDGSPQAMLDELFPTDLDAQILTRHPDAPSLSPSEQDFIDRSRQRKNYLLAENATDEALRELPKKYQWQDFVREFASCIAKHVDAIMNVPARSQPNFSGNAADRRATAAAAAALNTSSNTHQSNNNNRKATSKHTGSHSLDSTSTPSTTLDTASAKKPASAGSTLRQAWTKQEEDALLTGLERVDGPHWSQILALYGRGGSISEVLKDRNQVQLKDKARNLKLGYLKIGKDVPPALRGVTGELRKRGGARARAALGMADDGDGEDGDAGAGAADDEMMVDVASDAVGKKKGRRR